MVAHRCVKKGEFLLMVTQMAGPGGGLDHAHQPILGRGGKKRVIGQKLIAQDPDQAHGEILKQPAVFGSKNGLFRSEAGKE
jgi:hypothetical protein